VNPVNELFCESKLAKPKVFCTLRPKHSGPCSFYLSGGLADMAIADLRTKNAALRDALNSILESNCGHTIGSNTCLSDEVWTKAEEALSRSFE
jgi:hypothetical protein